LFQFWKTILYESFGWTYFFHSYSKKTKETQSRRINTSERDNSSVACKGWSIWKFSLYFICKWTQGRR
jgi:hypothetical protein